MDAKPVYPNLDAPTGPPQYENFMPGTASVAPMPQPAVITTQTPIYITQPGNVVQNHLGSKPTMAVCPSCHARQVSSVNYKSSSKTHLIALILCITTCCCCIPYCFDSCKSVEHNCASCGSYLGTYNN